MSLDSGAEGGFSKRQLMGLEYTQFTTDLSKEIKRNRDFQDFQVEVSGIAKEPPEIEPLQLTGNGGEAFVIYYDLDKFAITSKESGKTLDLVGITPEGWSQKTIDLTSPMYMPPEVHEALSAYQVVNPVTKECVINRNLGPADENGDKTVAICLWNTLIARFVEEIGNPANEESFIAMRDAILEKRSNVMAALKKKDDSNPQQIALEPFNTA